MQILVLAGLAGTISKATSNFPNAELVQCSTIQDCINEFVDDAGDSYSGLYGVFDIENSNVYTLTDPQLVPLAAFIRRDDCPQDPSVSGASVTLVASYALVALLSVFLTL
jgi:hypothetical protein